MTYIIGICGGSGSGKTHLAQGLLAEFGSDDAAVISIDSYYNDNSDIDMDKRLGINYDHPDSIDSTLLTKDIKSYKKGNEIAIPTYDFATHNRTSDLEIIENKKILIVEGILLFAYESLFSNLDYTVFVDCPAETRLNRRIHRDTRTRGRTEISVREQWADTVFPMHNLFVEPKKTSAKTVVNGLNFDKQAIYKLSVALEAVAESVEA